MNDGRWIKQAPLPTLDVKLEGRVLTVIGGDEHATVRLGDDDRIDAVEFRCGDVHRVINRADALSIVVGEKTWERDVVHFLAPGGPAPRMRLGLTVHRAEGTWSSLPHAFELNAELGFEEAFLYLLYGGTQRAIQVGRGVWSDGAPVDEAWTVEHRTLSTIPMGYHPLVGEPGVQVSYVWVYLVKHPHWEKISKDGKWI
jgi:5-deoxy-D-glucuronate isomerase